MKQKRWIILPVTLAFLLILLFFSLSVQAQARPTMGLTPTPTPTKTPTITPTSFPTPAVFTATMHVEPEKTILSVGDEIDVRISIDISEGCQYPVLELNLTQSGENAPLLSYVSPITDTIISPGPLPFTFTLRAEQVGVVTFQGLAFGERYCNDYWNWAYVGAPSAPVTILENKYILYFPFIQR